MLHRQGKRTLSGGERRYVWCTKQSGRTFPSLCQRCPLCPPGRHAVVPTVELFLAWQAVGREHDRLPRVLQAQPPLPPATRGLGVEDPRPPASPSPALRGG